MPAKKIDALCGSIIFFRLLLREIIETVFLFLIIV